VKAPSATRWADLWRQVSATASPEHGYDELVSLYSQPHRHYHNLRHLAECLAELDSARSSAQEPLALELAIWFHDAIYEPRAPDNEERSAELARQRIAGAGGSADLCRSVATLVLATRTHDPATHPDAPLLVDVDLSILGQGPDRFEEYEAQIRREYNWVPAETFAAKRAEILERFLARDRLYQTDRFFAKFERQARANLGNSVTGLRLGLTCRGAAAADCGLLAELNHQLIQDEGHCNPMNVAQLEQRMRDFLESDYRAVVFEQRGEIVAYALYREQPQEIYLRQLFVVRGRRRQGIGRQAMRLLRSEIWPETKRLTVEVLAANHPALAFWHAVGYADYSLMLEITPEKQ